jgi:hypothetical protein
MNITIIKLIYALSIEKPINKFTFIKISFSILENSMTVKEIFLKIATIGFPA